MMPTVTFDDLRTAINLPAFDPAPAHARMAPSPRRPWPERQETPPRQAGVLALVFPEADSLHVVLTRRAENLRGHSGQISFPGGSVEPQDESVVAAALRETCEELGLCQEQITVIGSLSPIYIPPTHFDVFPTVAIIAFPPVFDPNSDEVAEVFTFSLDALLDDSTRRQEYWNIQGYRVLVPFYLVRDHKVWGATAMILSELEHRLRAVLTD
jgi:8-oxo-dGTP pyrophosphatase MutT (NUDIX family)